MQLLVDIGNTRIKWGTSPGRGVVENHGNSSSIAEFINQLRFFARPDSIRICSVRHDNSLPCIIQEFSAMTWPDPEHVLLKNNLDKLRIAYKNPAHYGIDRFLALLSVCNTRQPPSIVISAGTAVTIDALDNRCVHKGGIILPGLRSMHTNLTSAAPVLLSEMGNIETHIGPWQRDTQDAVMAVLRYAWAGGVENVIMDMECDLGKADVVVTGGDGLLLTRCLKHDTTYEETLILRGLTYV